MFELVTKLLETDVAGVRRKQRSITSLFPTFPERVRGVADKGGVRLEDIDDTGVWKFKVHSGTEDDLWYDDFVRFVNLDQIIAKTAGNKKMWVKDGSRLNLSKLASEVLNRADIQLSCSCPAFLYWGSDYILSRPRRDAKYGDPENRRPRVRNPREYGAVCKHLEAVLRVYPFHTNTMAQYLKDFWYELITDMEEAASQEREGFKAAADELGRRKEEVELEEPLEEEPIEEPEEEEYIEEPIEEEPIEEPDEEEEEPRRGRRRPTRESVDIQEAARSISHSPYWYEGKPKFAFVLHPLKGFLVKLHWGEKGFTPVVKNGKNVTGEPAEKFASKMNREIGLSPGQVNVMLQASMFGWDDPQHINSAFAQEEEE